MAVWIVCLLPRLSKRIVWHGYSLAILRTGPAPSSCKTGVFKQLQFSPLGSTGNLPETRLIRYLPKIGTYCSRRSRKSGSELCNAGTDSRQFEEVTTCSPGGSDSPKLRTTSARSGGPHSDRSWMVVYLRFSFARTPPQRFHLPDYLRTSVAGAMHRQTNTNCSLLRTPGARPE